MTLQPMTPPEFALWKDQFVREWADDLARVDELPVAEAVRRAERALAEQLPEGVATKDHWLFTLCEAGRRVGTLWYSRTKDGAAFLDDVTIAPDERRKGHGRTALALLEADAKARGCRRVVLNVYGHNPGALALYEQAGYATKRREMAKPI